jgi:hypothetical protein
VNSPRQRTTRVWTADPDIREELSNTEFVAFTVFLQDRRRNKFQKQRPRWILNGCRAHQFRAS